MYIETLRGFGPNEVIWVRVEESCCANVVARRASPMARLGIIASIPASKQPGNNSVENLFGSKGRFGWRLRQVRIL